MVDAIANLAPQQVPVEGTSEAGKQPVSPELAFTDALAGAIGDGNETAATPTATPAHDESETKPAAADAALTELVGAVQVAMAMPVQNNVPAAVEGPTQATEGDPVVPVVSNGGQSVGPQSVAVNDIPAGAVPTAAAPTEATAVQPGAVPVDAPSEALAEPAVQAAVQPDVGVDAAEAPSVQTDGIPVDTKPVASAKPDAATVPETASVPVADKADAPDVPVAAAAARPDAAQAVDSAPRTDRPTAQAQGLVDKARPMQGESPKPDKPAETQTIETRPTTPAFQRTPERPPSAVGIETTPVQWRYDASKRTTPAAVGAPNTTGALAVEAAVQSVAGSSVKSTGKDAGETSDQGMPSQQAVAPMAQHFAAQLQEAAQPVRPERVDGPAQEMHARVIDQVVREVSLHRVGDPNGADPNGASRTDIVVKLNPPELGSLRLQVTQDSTGMTTHIQSGSSQVRGLLEAHMPLLIDSLAKAGVRMDSVSVSTGTSFNAFAGNAQQQHAQPNASHARQQYVPVREPFGIETVAASQSGWAMSSQAGHSWLA